jgi:hypothetical protein
MTMPACWSASTPGSSASTIRDRHRRVVLQLVEAAGCQNVTGIHSSNLRRLSIGYAHGYWTELGLIVHDDIHK